MRYLYILLAVFAFSCNNEQPAKKETVPAGPLSSDLNTKDLEGMKGILSVYYQLKDAMVASDAAAVTAQSEALATAIGNYRTAITDSQKAVVLRPYLDTMTARLQEMHTSANIEQQRIPFQPVSDALYGALEAVHLKNSGVFQEYCPMAFDNKGAHWLSNNPEIKNPYFGKKMLECGEVTDTL
jgi:hemoglobin-like flavoprotein